MSSTPMSMPGPDVAWELPSRGRVGMFSLIAAESAIFIIFVVAYLYYFGKSLTGPIPKDVLRMPDLLYGLPAVEQPDDSLRRQSGSAGEHPYFPQLVVRDGCARSRVSFRHGARMVPADFP